MALLAVAFPKLAAGDLRWIQGLRQVHDPAQHARVEPHLTLVFPTDGVPEHEFVAHVQGVAAGTPPFEFALCHAVAIEDGVTDEWHVFLVPEDGSEALIALHDRLYTGPLAPHLRRDLPFLPHLTVASSPDRETCEGLAAHLTQQDIEVPGTVRALTVLRYEAGRVERLIELPLFGAA